ncbi:hypothetical protein KJY73_06805 [Bowmanella sp. Y26]|nr:hypothetical protein [Bowmanella yangjiangensis]
MSYGVGLSYRINSKFDVFLDYQVLPDFEPASNYSVGWKSTTLGLNYSF